MRRSRTDPGRLAGPLLARAILLGTLWWAFTEGHGGSWILSGLAVLTAVLSSFFVLPPGSWPWRHLGLVRFLPFFLQQSIRGGIDVAGRALHPRLPIHPGSVDYPLRLPEGLARVFFITTLSLLPGTLSMQLREDTLRVHLLDCKSPARERIEQLEVRVAAVFGMEI